MKMKEKLSVKESQIEDILATYPDILCELLKIKGELTLVGRQKILPSGNRIDLLFISGKDILLIELKVENFDVKFIKQIEDYKLELLKLQDSGQLINGKIISFLLCTGVSETQQKLCNSKNIESVVYSPYSILENFYFRLRNLSQFIVLKPTNHGLWNLHLLNRILYSLDTPKSVQHLVDSSGLSRSTINSYLRLAKELLLVYQKERTWELTSYGKRFVYSGDRKEYGISDEQSKIIQELIIQNPFASGAILGVYILIESIFNLSKNTYPVPENFLAEYFKQSSGRIFEWNDSKTTHDSLRMYSNYCLDIGLIGKIGDKYFLTPDGFRFILLSSLHKSIKIIDALGIARGGI